MPPRLWMNLTTSARWTRPAVGIVRVEQELERALSEVLGERLLGFVADERGFHRHRSEPQRREGAGAGAAAHGLGRGDVLLDVGLDWSTWGEHSTRHYARLRERGVRVVTCCHDLVQLLYPQYTNQPSPDNFRRYLHLLTEGSDAVLCISRCTEQDYLAFCAPAGLAPPRTALLPLGDNVPEDSGAISDRVREAAAAPFILYVSTIERRKNHEAIYRAFHLLARAGRRAVLPRFVMVGMPGWGISELQADIARDPLVRGLFLHLDRVTDAELAHLYRQARFCVYPSLYEGWGLPVAEALALGKAVVSSDRGSLPEVGGDLVLYADPWNPHAWADAIATLCEDPARVRAMEARVRERYARRTWAQAATSVIELIDSLDRA